MSHDNLPVRTPRALRMAGLFAALLATLPLLACAASGSLAPVAEQGITAVGSAPVTVAGGILSSCISTIAGLKQQLNGAPSVP